MTDPTDRRPEGGGPDPFERELRRTLAARAADAPDAHALTERLLAGASADRFASVSPMRPRGWRAWGTPLVAAACVVAIAGIVLAIARPGPLGHGSDAANTRSASVPSAITSAPTTPSAVPTSTPTSATASGGTARLRNVSIVDLTFDTQQSGWALASADCLGKAGLCTALLRTTNGTSWHQFTNTTPFDVPGVDGCPKATCVTNIRFANDSTGFAFGPDALFVTQDGARHWTPEPGGAYALETLDNDVIRLVGSSSGCGGPCNLHVEVAALGSSVWKTVALSPQTVDAANVTLLRTGRSAFVQVTSGNEGLDNTSVIYASGNDGATWSVLPSPCASVKPAELETVDLATAADGSLSVLCGRSAAAQAAGRASFVRTSADGGATFGAPVTVTGSGAAAAAADGGSLGPLGAASARILVAYGADGLYRSVDGGHTWRRVLTDTSEGTVLAPGFESSTVGRWVSPDGHTIWTTRDAGASWTPYRL